MNSDKFLKDPNDIDVDIGLTWFHSQVPIEENTPNRSDTNQSVAGTYASVIRTSLCRRENKVSWINRVEESNECIRRNRFCTDHRKIDCKDRRVTTRDTINIFV